MTGRRIERYVYKRKIHENSILLYFLKSKMKYIVTIIILFLSGILFTSYADQRCKVINPVIFLMEKKAYVFSNNGPTYTKDETHKLITYLDSVKNEVLISQKIKPHIIIVRFPGNSKKLTIEICSKIAKIGIDSLLVIEKIREPDLDTLLFFNSKLEPLSNVPKTFYSQCEYPRDDYNFESFYNRYKKMLTPLKTNKNNM